MRIHSFLLGALLASTSLVAFAAADGAGSGSVPETVTKTILKQNGIKRPDTGTVTGKLWDIADEESAKLGAPAPRKVVVDRYMAEQPLANVATANTQYARWVQYHGASEVLKANRAAAKAAKAGESEQAKAAKAAEKEAAKQAKEQAKKEAAEKRAAEKAAKAAAAAKPAEGANAGASA